MNKRVSINIQPWLYIYLITFPKFVFVLFIISSSKFYHYYMKSIYLASLKIYIHVIQIRIFLHCLNNVYKLTYYLRRNKLITLKNFNSNMRINVSCSQVVRPYSSKTVRLAQTMFNRTLVLVSTVK